MEGADGESEDVSLEDMSGDALEAVLGVVLAAVFADVAGAGAGVVERAVAGLTVPLCDGSGVALSGSFTVTIN